MELPPFELLYTTSDILNELETALEELDQSKLFKDVGRRRRRRRNGGLYGVGFEAEDPDYYNPVGICCDIAFYTNEEYKRHLDNHVKCPVEGCPFTSHQKAMRVHQEVIHNSGLFNVIYRETCDKSVKVWRESRKRNYPTMERVEAKKKLIEERIERGEIFETPQFGSMNKPNSNVLRSSQIGEVNASSNKMSTSSKKTSKTSKQCQTNSPSPVVTNQESSIRLVPTDYDSESTDNDNITVKDKSSCDITDPTTEPVEKFNNTSSSRRRKRGRKQKGDKTNDNPDNENTENSQDDPFASHPLVKLQVKRRQCLSDIHRIHSRPTLLQMLLAEDIRKERNQLMQCIRYIVNENFFQV
ncbi:unnamed protein product [Schistosoma intercalatum]|nr:unnamed protein product [Schistosoma intercalatum]